MGRYYGNPMMDIHGRKGILFGSKNGCLEDSFVPRPLLIFRFHVWLGVVRTSNEIVYP